VALVLVVAVGSIVALASFSAPIMVSKAQSNAP
jgi:hypothetical protein